MMKNLFLLLISLLFLHSFAFAKKFSFAFQGDLKGLDPQALFETFQIGTLSNVYEPLINIDKDMKLVPALAVSWKSISNTEWQIKLRKGVKFHNGNDFNAQDVVFSWERGLLTDLSGIMKKFKNIRIVDDHTIIIQTAKSDPLIPRSLIFFHIMDKEWTKQHKADQPHKNFSELYTNANANGTGPFMAVSYQAGVKSVFKRFANHWNKDIVTNVQEVVIKPINQDSTRVAALLSKAVDMAYPIPLQDQKRIQKDKNVDLLTGPETRSIFIGMDQWRDELVGSNVKGANPFKDIRVREAFVRAINVKLINKKIMRGTATPLGSLINKSIANFDPKSAVPYRYSPKMAKRLMKEAGYEDGFKIVMDCPNNRYVNDEKICQAVVSMLAKINVKVQLHAQPKNQFFAKVLASNGYDTSFYLLGWSPSDMDAGNTIAFLIACRDQETGYGLYNLGDYCNPKIDKLLNKINVEMDAKKRKKQIAKALRIVRKDFAYIPLHAQALSWGLRKGIALDQRPDNVLDWRSIVLE